MRFIRFSRVIRGGLLTGVLAGSLSAHAEVDALVRDAQALTANGQFAQAYALLEPQEINRAGDPDFDLAFGIAANESGHHTRSVLALERLLAVQPDNARGREALGRS